MRFLLLPVVFLVSVVALAQGTSVVVEPDTEVPFEALASDTVAIYTVVEQNAEFPGGYSAMMEYFRQNIRYPEEEQDERIEGKVFLQFVIRRDGSVDDVQVLRGVPGGRGLEREAVRVVKSMPLWTPASMNGITVNSRFTVPIMFKLTE